MIHHICNRPDERCILVSVRCSIPHSLAKSSVLTYTHHFTDHIVNHLDSIFILSTYWNRWSKFLLKHLLIFWMSLQLKNVVYLKELMHENFSTKFSFWDCVTSKWNISWSRNNITLIYRVRIILKELRKILLKTTNVVLEVRRFFELLQDHFSFSFLFMFCRLAFILSLSTLFLTSDH